MNVAPADDTASALGARWAREAWLRYWRANQRWHRYEVRGFEHLEGPPALIVGYHGRSIARDLCMLTASVHDRMGYIPHAFFHRAFGEYPGLRSVLAGVGGLTGDAASLEAVLERGEHLLTTPGGTGEGCRSHRHRYRVRWGDRMGYLKLALKYGLDLVPAAASGTDDTYIGLNDGDAWSRRLHAPANLPVWLGVGPLGLWPLSPPFPVKVTQHIGPRIHLPRVAREDHAGLAALHAQVVDTVQGLLDAARGGR